MFRTITRSIPWVVRIVMAVDFLALAAAGGYAALRTEPSWYREPVLQSSVAAGMLLALFWTAAELFIYLFPQLVARLWILFVAPASLLSSTFYVLPAALYGQQLSDESTWHLLPMFTVMYVLGPLAISSFLAAILLGCVLPIIEKYCPESARGNSLFSQKDERCAPQLSS